MNKEEVVNRLGLGNYLESNLVYPLDKGYSYICKVDKSWVLTKTWGKEIANKYAYKIDNRLYVNHDGDYWLIEK